MAVVIPAFYRTSIETDKGLLKDVGCNILLVLPFTGISPSIKIMICIDNIGTTKHAGRILWK